MSEGMLVAMGKPFIANDFFYLAKNNLSMRDYDAGMLNQSY